MKLGKIAVSDYDKPREPMPTLRFRFDDPVMHGAVLRQLGAPSTWDGDATPADVLAPLVRAASETARRLALAEPSGVEVPMLRASRARRRTSVKKAGKKRVK